MIILRAIPVSYTHLDVYKRQTRGVDIGVKQAMYQLMVKLKNEGKSILMISEEMPELIGMSDRILIMKDGEITAEFERNKNLSDSQIIEYMI